MRITVIGTGYVGLVVGACLAETGNDVIAPMWMRQDRRAEEERAADLRAGAGGARGAESAQGRLEFTTDVAAAIAEAEVVFIAVGTPPDEDGSADLRHVLAVAEPIGKHMTREMVVVTKSTVPVGTADEGRARRREARAVSLSRRAAIPSSSRKAPRSTTS